MSLLILKLAFIWPRMEDAEGLQLGSRDYELQSAELQNTWLAAFLTLVPIFHWHFTFWWPQHSTSVGFHPHNCFYYL